MKHVLLYSALLGLACSSAQAASVASVNGTSWNLTGKFTAKVSAKCQKGGGAGKTGATPFSKLNGNIQFFDDTADSDTNTGRFTWTDDQFRAFTTAGIAAVQGKWTQQGARINLTLDDINTSPLTAYGLSMQQAFGYMGSFSGSQNGATAQGSAGNFKLSNTKLTGNLASAGKKLQLNESITMSFDASATGSYGGYSGSNSCSFKYTLGRTYTGTR